MAIVRAVDVGFGNVKYVVDHTHGFEVECGVFPSLAPQVVKTMDIGAGVLARRNTVTVTVNNTTYEVGKDAELALDASHGRVLDRSYPQTDTYLALLRGALAYMAQPHINLLVLGLPVNNYDQYRELLEAKMSGTHLVPNVRRRVDEHAAEEVNVTVDHVWVLPQPLGGFFDHAIRSKLFSSMKNQQNLIIDAGFFTLDWLMAAGTKPIGSRSGAVNGGMSAILSVVAEAIGREHNTQITNLKRLDDAVRNGESLNLFGQGYDISKHVDLGRTKAREFVAMLVNKVGDGADIDNIILAGGGAAFFKEIVQEKFPRHKLIIAHDPVFANVRGFQLAGEERARANATNAARAVA